MSETTMNFQTKNQMIHDLTEAISRDGAKFSGSDLESIKANGQRLSILSTSGNLGITLAGAAVRLLRCFGFDEKERARMIAPVVLEAIKLQKTV